MDPNLTDDVDDETLGAFERVVKKYAEKNPEWLSKLIPSSSSQPGSDPSKSPTAFDPMTFFQKRTESLEERLEAAMALMTPEQLTSLRSQLVAAKGGQKEPEKSGAPNAAPPTPPAVPPAKKRTWL